MNKLSKVFIKNEKATPLIMLDGKIIDKREMEAIDPNDIKSVNVLISETAVEQFGEKGKNGVIMITTKEAAAKVAKKEIAVL